jgi:RimJ/RimL family protein N-acetyltransferase
MGDVILRLWSEEDLPLLEKLMGDPHMMAYLGGPETPEQIRKRHQRYLLLSETDHMFVILWGPESDVSGSIGYWERNWRDQRVFEMGWFVLSAFQGRGIATKAGEAVIEQARLDNK